MENMTQVRELKPDYRMRMAGNVARSDNAVWQCRRMMVSGIIKKELS